MCQSTVSLGEKQAQYFLWQQVDLINQQQAVKSEKFASPFAPSLSLSCLLVERSKSLREGNFQQFHYETIFILQPFCCLPRASSAPKVVSLAMLWISYFGIQKIEHNGSEKKRRPTPFISMVKVKYLLHLLILHNCRARSGSYVTLFVHLGGNILNISANKRK